MFLIKICFLFCGNGSLEHGFSATQWQKMNNLACLCVCLWVKESLVKKDALFAAWHTHTPKDVPTGWGQMTMKLQIGTNGLLKVNQKEKKRVMGIGKVVYSVVGKTVGVRRCEKDLLGKCLPLLCWWRQHQDNAWQESLQMQWACEQERMLQQQQQQLLMWTADQIKVRCQNGGRCRGNEPNEN